MGIDIAKLVVDLIKGIAWPLVVTIVALAFRRELVQALTSILGRKIEVEGPGFKAKIDAAEQQSAAANPATEKLPKPATLEPSPRPAVNFMENRLQDDLASVEPGKREAVLVRALALSRMEAGHEFTYNRIFGSQIAGLKRLNEAGKVTIDQAREFFEPFARSFPQVYSSYGFDGWLGFLLGQGLIAQIGNSLEITEIGRDFLFYLTERRLSENKPW